MTIQDQSNWNTLERVTSSKLNEQQQLRSREQAEAFRALVRKYTIDLPPTVAPRSHIASGLSIEQSGGSTVVVNPGMLAQQVAASPPQVPTPGTYDSTYRTGLNLSVLDATDPWDATSAWWLLQARVEQVATTGTPDIYDPTTDTFAPAGAPIDIRYQSQVVVAWKKGTATAIASQDAGYAPLGACYRPAGGGAIADSDIIQLSTQIGDLSPYSSDTGAGRRTGYRFDTDIGLQGGTAASCRFQWSGETNGVQLFAKATGDIVLRHADFIDPTYSGIIGTADYWWYCYLAAVGDQMPSNIHSNIEHRGAIIVSRVAPDIDGKNSGSLTVPDPIGGSVAAGEAIFVGLFKAASTGSTIFPQMIADSGEGHLRPQQLFVMNSGNSYQNGVTFNFNTTGPGGTEELPYGVVLHIETQMTRLDVTSTALGMNQDIWQWSTSVGRRTHSLRPSCRSIVDVRGWMHTNNDLVLNNQVTAYDTNLGGIAIGGIANNEYETNLVGYKF
jgi:hypothetical protein